MDVEPGRRPWRDAEPQRPPFTYIDLWHRPKRGKGPLRSLCLRCYTPVSRHPNWWRRFKRSIGY